MLQLSKKSLRLDLDVGVMAARLMAGDIERARELLKCCAQDQSTEMSL